MAGPDCRVESVGQNQFKKILASEGIEFLTTVNGKVPCSAVDGKTVCLFFSANWCRPCKAFTPNLVKLYNSLKKRDENLEIIFVSSDRDENAYNEQLQTMPWPAVPFSLNLYTRLAGLFNIKHIPALFPLGSGKGNVEDDAVSMVEDYGADAYPFTRERRDQLRAMDERKRGGGRIEELLAHAERDYIISRTGRQVQSSQVANSF